jgi:hypothetical protein
MKWLRFSYSLVFADLGKKLSELGRLSLTRSRLAPLAQATVGVPSKFGVCDCDANPWLDSMPRARGGNHR